MSLKVLFLSRSYPNNLIPTMGLWVARLLHGLSDRCEARVIAPVPYSPPLPGLPEFTRFRQIKAQRQQENVTVYHPRFLVGPGYALHSSEALTYYLGVRRLIDRLRSEFPFDVIHAHFSYPDGVAAAWLGRRYGVPVVVTEHACWRPWMDQFPLARRQAVHAAAKLSFHIAVSTHVRNTIAHFTGETDRIRVIPVGVDGSIFRRAQDGKFNLRQILFVGFINYNKGVDLLLKAMHQIRQRQPDVRLVLVGGSIYRNTRRQQEQLEKMAQDMELGDRVTFVGPKTSEEVARYMRESAVLVLPSRRESFGAVLVEALACGTPVVATRCGGPEDIITDEVGVLIAPEDENALAQGIEHVLENRSTYAGERLRHYALQRFSWERVANDTANLYHEASGIVASKKGKQWETEAEIIPARN
jgi:teichuronic acid biosynthesis glycosyltransferase TuaC